MRILDVDADEQDKGKISGGRYGRGNREVRYLTVRELRASGEGEAPRISGYAAVFDVLVRGFGGISGDGFRGGRLRRR